MKSLNLKVEQRLCGECSLALRRFIGGLEGVADIGVGSGKISIAFDETKMPEERLLEISKSSIERLGYRVEDE